MPDLSGPSDQSNEGLYKLVIALWKPVLDRTSPVEPPDQSGGALWKLVEGFLKPTRDWTSPLHRNSQVEGPD
jgi:hypothetical protein